MPRKRRPDEPGMFHHVTLRGVAGMPVFRDEADRRRFLAFTSRYVRDGGARCYAWALMDNHVHLVLRTGDRPLREVVHGFAFRYAQHFNWRHARPGHLFQNRFGSSPIEDDAYLRTAISYVHLNPVRAGMTAGIESLATYRWTSFAGLLGSRADRLVHEADTLALFAEDAGAARTALIELTRACLRASDDDPSWHWTAGLAAAGAGERIDVCGMMRDRMDALQRARDESETSKIRAARLRRDGWNVDAVIAAVCTLQRVAPHEILSIRRRRAVSDARAIVAHLAMTDLRASVAELARRLDLSETAVARAARRGAVIAAERGLSLGEGLLRRVRAA